jgi:hypothetical protein
MTQLDDAHAQLADARAHVAASLPLGRTAALLAVLRVGDAAALDGATTYAARPGWNLTLRLCLDRPQGDGDDERNLPDARAERFLTDCDQLAAAELALARCEAGELQLQQLAPGDFVAWGAIRRLSSEQRERADFDWWSAQLARQAVPRLTELEATGADGASAADADRYYRQLGAAHVARFVNQHSYPPEAAIGGATFGQYADLLAVLLGWLFRDRDALAPDAACVSAPREERALCAALAVALRADPAALRRALQSLILDDANAAYHSTLPGLAAPPLIRLDAERVICSAVGLLSEPLIFLTRELRRRHAQEYHNSAHLREGEFRHDLYQLFDDKRYVLSAGTVELRRDGVARTDLDALVFDRKTATLGVFELKAQDPFARSVEERLRQRDNFYRANRQVSAILEWAQRRGADDVLSRFDDRVAKRLHVQKLHVFVLGPYLAHFTGGPEPDRRAAWGCWPQGLRVRVLGGWRPDQRDPLGALFARLRDAPTPEPPANDDSQTIDIGGFRLRVYPTFADLRAAEQMP